MVSACSGRTTTCGTRASPGRCRIVGDAELLGRTDVRARPVLRAAGQQRRAAARRRVDLGLPATAGRRDRARARLDHAGRARRSRRARARSPRSCSTSTRWALTFDTAHDQRRPARPIAIGSPTTKGRENAGYGGLFWRGPRSFTGRHGSVAPAAGGGDDLRGTRAEWMGFRGRHDDIDARVDRRSWSTTRQPASPAAVVRAQRGVRVPEPGARSSARRSRSPPAKRSRFRYAVVIADGDERTPRAPRRGAARHLQPVAV